MTSFTGGRLFEIDKTANLAQTFLGILDEFRHRYLVSYTPRRGCRRTAGQARRAREELPSDRQSAPGYLAADNDEVVAFPPLGNRAAPIFFCLPLSERLIPDLAPLIALA